MATVTAGLYALDYDNLDVGALVFGDTIVANATTISIRLGGWVDTFSGSFSYDAKGQLSGGVLNRWQETYNGQKMYDISDVAISAVQFQQWALTSDNDSALKVVLGGADSLVGSPQGDLMRGYDGADIIWGGGGADSLDAGAGNDSVHGEAGDDIILGGDGTNFLRGEDGNDLIRGGDQFDDIHGNTGADTGYGGAGDDWVVGGQGADQLFGEAGDDIVYGNIGADTVSGGDGFDWVRGGQDNDSISAGAGADWISGDRGDDTISGGTGADTFYTFTDAGLDRILDFNRADGDHIKLDPGVIYSAVQTGADVVVTIGGSAQVVLVGVQLASLSDGWIGIA